MNIAESRAVTMLRDEFLINMQKFESNVTRILQQIAGEVKLVVPDVFIPENNADAQANKDLMVIICETCTDWARQILVCCNFVVL